MSILGKEVPFRDIRKELKLLSAGDDARAHASLMNLAVFTEDATQLEQMYEQVSELTRNHTCRALTIVLDREAPEQEMTSWVSAHCNMTNGKKAVCCEHISFLLKGYVYGRLRNTIFSLINSDLPLVFWWQGDLSDVFEPRLYTLIDRFIFDSTEWSDPAAGYESLLIAADEVQRRFIIQDLAWTRSYTYRLAFAAMFDTALAQEELPNLSEAFVQVREGEETVGLLLLSWLATQAGWTLKGGEGSTYEFLNSDGKVIKGALKIGGDDSISAFGVSSEKAKFVLQSNRENKMIEQVVSNESGEHTYMVSSMIEDKVALVEDQLSRGGKNALLRKTIPLFMDLLRVS